MRQSVVIIGAGPGGLASALLLAKAGLDVRIIEKRERVGGRTSAIEAEGFRFDVGPTFFLYPQVLREIFSAVGRDLDHEVPMRRLDPQYRLVFGSGGELNATPNVALMKEEIAKLNPDDANHFERYLSDNARKLQLFKPILQSPFAKLTDMVRSDLLKSVTMLRPTKSVDGDLQSYFSDERVRLAFSFQSKYLGMSPFKCPSLFTILSYLEYAHGVWHPIGGCSAVMEAMARVAGELGVRIHLSESVEGIEFAGRRAKAVRTQRSMYHCDALVINSDFAHTMQKLVPDQLRRRWTNQKLATKKFSCSTFMMYLGVQGLDQQLAHHNIYLSKNYHQNLDDIERLHVLSDDPSVYVQNAGVTDDTLAPKGMSTLYVLSPVTHQSNYVDWSRDGRTFHDFRAKVLHQVARLGVRDVEKRIVFEKAITPDDWRDDYAIHLGATFNLAHNLGQMLHLRPNNRFEDLQSVYLVGGGTHPGSGLPVIFESARITSRLLTDDLGVKHTAHHHNPLQPDASILNPAPAYATVRN